MSATIVSITSLTSIPEADKIETARVLGWDVVVKKGDFQVGDLAIYFTIDSLLSNPEASFLEGKPLKTKKLRGQISQGLLSQLSWLGDLKVVEDEDVTEILGVTKYIQKEESHLFHGANKDKRESDYHPGVPKTDEHRLQGIMKKINMTGRRAVVTQKYDGTSTTFVFDGSFNVYGRNYQIPKDAPKGQESYWAMEKKYDIQKKMEQLDQRFAIQGECVGPKINNNRLGLKEVDFFVFNIYDLENHKYLQHDKVMKITEQLGLKHVPVIHEGEIDVTKLMELADSQVYFTGTVCEGIVVKSCDDGPRISFKVISNNYLLKYKL